MKFRILHWIIIIDILSILLLLSILFIPSTAVRIILGLPFLLFFPGYTLTSALFVRKDGIDNPQKLALSLGMSVAIAGIIGMILNYTTSGIKLEPVLYAITGFIFITSLIALIRRAIILDSNIFTTNLEIKLPAWGTGKFNKFLSITLIVVIISALGVFIYTTIAPKTGEMFSEFYILGINRNTQDYPTEYVMDGRDVIKVIYSEGSMDTTSGFGVINLGIVNHEQQTESYYVKTLIDSEPVNINSGGLISEALGPIELQNGEMFEDTINIVPEYIKDDQKVELLLFKGTDTIPYDTLHYWIDVKDVKRDATLTDLSLSSGLLTPLFVPDITSYTAEISDEASTVSVIPTVNDSSATVIVNDDSVNSGTSSKELAMDYGTNVITIIVNAEDGSTKTYTIEVTKTKESL